MKSHKLRTLERYLLGIEDVLQGEISAHYKSGEMSGYEVGAKAKMNEEIGHIQTALKLLEGLKED